MNYSPKNNLPETKALTGTMRALANNVIEGVSNGFQKKLEINGGRKISGTVVISGSKNATLPILAATVLTDKKIIIKN